MLLELRVLAYVIKRWPRFAALTAGGIFGTTKIYKDVPRRGLF